MGVVYNRLGIKMTCFGELARQLIDLTLVGQALNLTIIGAGTAFGLLLILVGVLSSFRLIAERYSEAPDLNIVPPDINQDSYRDKALAGAIAVVTLIEKSKRDGTH